MIFKRVFKSDDIDKNKLEIIIAILCLIGVLGYFVYVTIEMKGYAPWVDETANLLAMRNFLDEGVFRVGPVRTDINFENLPFTQIYNEYALELLIRLPCFWISERLNIFELNYVPGFMFALFAAMLSMHLMSLWTSKCTPLLIPVIFWGVASVWYMADLFHYIRYCSFFMIAIIFAVFLCTHFHFATYDNNIKCVIKKIGVIISSCLPMLFNQTGIIFFAAVVVLEGIDFIKEILNSAQNGRRCKYMKLLVVLVTLICCVILIRPIINNLIHFVGGYEDIDLNYIIVFFKMALFSTPIGIIVGSLTATCLLFNWRGLSKELKYIIKVCFVIILFFIISAPLIGRRLNHARYVILPSTAYIIIVSIAIITFVQLVSNKLKIRSPLLCSAILICSSCAFFYAERMDTYGGEQAGDFYLHQEPFMFETINEYKEYLSSIDPAKEVIIFTDTPSCINFFMPNYKLYMLRDVPKDAYEKAPGTLLDDGICFMLDDGRVKNIYNDEYIGNMAEYLKVLKSIKTPDDTLIVYFDVSDMRMADDLKTYFSNHPELWSNGLSVSDHINIAIEAGIIGD